jgi:glycosyltransferase involved in cell wall biosynthesis
MKVLIVGKFPPIQGGVSAQTHRFAHALARRGHAVLVVTNAREVEVPFRMWMRDEDWSRCEASPGEGYVRVFWTSPTDRRQFHIPMASPFVTKLASLGLDAVQRYSADVVLSYYAEPYAIAGHLIAEAAGLPHVVRLAGSDAGRLWLHPQFTPLYDHVFRSATLLNTGRIVSEKLASIGISRDRIRTTFDYTVDEAQFTPDGPALDVQELLDEARTDASFESLCRGEWRPDLRYFGVYGKLGPKKGTAALLRALGRLKNRGRSAGLLIMGHARQDAAGRYKALADELGIGDRVVQIPFLPNWRVPEFIRRCLAVCYLEQDFPIVFHAPIVAREVMACGGCLVASTEILRKLPFNDRVVHGYNVVAIRDVDDTEELAGKLAAIIDRPGPAPIVGARGRDLLRQYQKEMQFPRGLESLLEDAITLGRSPAGKGGIGAAGERALAQRAPARIPAVDPPAAQSDSDPLFRLACRNWALASGEIADLVPKSIVEFRITAMATPANDRAASVAATVPTLGSGAMAIDGFQAAVLALCDGTRSVAEIASMLGHDQCDAETRAAADRFVLSLFEIGVLSLSERDVAGSTPVTRSKIFPHSL